MVKVKICGLTNREDVEASVRCGADLLGFILVPGTPRYIDKDGVRSATDRLTGADKRPGIVGLFMDEDIEKVAETVHCCGMDHVQLHGAEPPDYCVRLRSVLKEKYGKSVRVIKTFKVSGKVLPAGAFIHNDYECPDLFLFDTFVPDMAGGTGRMFDWKVLAEAKNTVKKPFFIAGGLGPGNVKEAVRAVGPYGVDVVSGVESSKGRKDHKKLEEFIKNAKEA